MAEEVKEQSNCPACGKPIKKVRRYYRNGMHYCTKKCWRKKANSKENAEKA